MELSSEDHYKQGLQQIATSEIVEEERKRCALHPSKTLTTSLITNFSDDCLNLIFLGLKTSIDRNSFCLTCCPELTDIVTSQSQYFGSHVQVLYLDNCSKLSNVKLCLVLSWFPRLTTISLKKSGITDKGLAILAEPCSSLQNVNLSECQLISDLGVRFVSQNCRELCHYHCNLESEGIKAIVSGGVLEHLNLAGSMVNNRTVAVILKGCPLLREWNLGFCYMVDLEGWQAIGLNCNNLEELDVLMCLGLKDLGLQALCDGCSKLSKLYIGALSNISFPAEGMFNSKRPNVIRRYISF
ncbi:hypothetical protein MKX01_038644 [Papaver californicum]|nr:hypothetical protein MKX01_038644 [Papaver californicum]